MTTKETAGVLALLREYYPRDIASTDLQTKTRAWHLVLADYPFPVVKAAAVAFAAHDTKGFMPTPGQLIDEIQRTQTSSEMTAQDAWTLAEKAASGNLAWDKLPELVQKAIGSPTVLREWGMTDERAFHTVIYSQFIKAYGIYQQRDKELAAIPADIRAMLGAVADKMALPGEDAG